MDGTHRRARALLKAAGTALAVAGPVMMLRGRGGRKEIRGEPASQRITFPDGGLGEELAPYAGRRPARHLTARKPAGLRPRSPAAGPDGTPPRDRLPGGKD
ncbi:hypothetical protein [Streptomyces sp. NPDC096152]|uniref:hypothetical protein n=1 Tax=Streptomyces sp. NPDC096152 TaxID=3366078 RepID=UPI003821D6B9